MDILRLRPIVIYKVVTYRTLSPTRSGRYKRELAVFGQHLRVCNYVGKRLCQNQNGGPVGRRRVGVGEKAAKIFSSRKERKGRKEANREKKINTVDSR